MYALRITGLNAAQSRVPLRKIKKNKNKCCDAAVIVEEANLSPFTVISHESFIWFVLV